jgi:hypothetical protein
MNVVVAGLGWWGKVLASQRTVQWWEEQNRTEFADLQKRLPGRLHLGRERMDHGHAVDELIMAARRAPLFVYRNVSCLWTPPKPRCMDLHG